MRSLQAQFVSTVASSRVQKVRWDSAVVRNALGVFCASFSADDPLRKWEGDWMQTKHAEIASKMFVSSSTRLVHANRFARHAGRPVRPTRSDR